VGIIVAVASPLLVLLFKEPRLAPITLCYAAVIPFSGLATLPSALTMRRLKFGYLAFCDVVPPILGLSAGITAALHGMGYWSLVIAALTETLSGSTLIFFGAGWVPGLPRYDKDMWKVFAVGGHITAYNITTYVTTTIYNVLLGVTYGSSALGLYDKGYRTVTQPIGQLMSPFGRVAVPMLSRLRDEQHRYRYAFRRMTQLLMFVSLPGVSATIILSHLVVSVLLGAKWIGVAPVMAWLSFGALGSSVAVSASWLFVSQGRTREQLRYSLINATLAVSGFLAGLPWGPTGVATGAGLTFSLICVPLTCWGATRGGIVRLNDFMSAIAPLIAAGAVAFAAVWAMIHLLPSLGGLHGIFAGYALSYSAFCACLMILKPGRAILLEVWQLPNMLKSNRPAAVQAG
jgi:PST family polysaccharide transporter